MSEVGDEHPGRGVADASEDGHSEHEPPALAQRTSQRVGAEQPHTGPQREHEGIVLHAAWNPLAPEPRREETQQLHQLRASQKHAPCVAAMCSPISTYQKEYQKKTSQSSREAPCCTCHLHPRRGSASTTPRQTESRYRSGQRNGSPRFPSNPFIIGAPFVLIFGFNNKGTPN